MRYVLLLALAAFCSLQLSGCSFMSEAEAVAHHGGPHHCEDCDCKCDDCGHEHEHA